MEVIHLKQAAMRGELNTGYNGQCYISNKIIPNEQSFFKLSQLLP